MSLALVAYEPVTNQGLYAGDFVEDITANHEGYNHVITAVGGYDTASFTLKGTRDYLNDWYDDGLFRRVVLYNPEGLICWEGYIERLRLTSGTMQKTKAIDTMYNRIYLRYSPLDFSVFPPIAGTPITLILSDLDSQLIYGVKGGIISGGERENTTAYDWGRTVLKEKKDPPVGESQNLASGDTASLEVECKGFVHTLKWIPYISQIAGSLPSHQVIQEILRYFNVTNPGFISQDFGLMDYNFRRERRGYDELQTCWDVISSIIGNGGRGGERWVGGVYQNRQFVYKAAEDAGGLYGEEFELWRSLQDTGQAIYDVAIGNEVKPWDMLPDRVLHTVDVNAGGDKNLMYIEQVTYTAPYTVQLVGGDDERLTVYLAQKGLSAI